MGPLANSIFHFTGTTCVAEIASALGVAVKRLPRPGVPSQLVRVEDNWRIYLNSTASYEDQRWGLAYRLAEHVLRLEGLGQELRGELAGALAIPRVESAADVLASRWQTPLPAAYLRVAEVTGTPTAVVRKGWSRRRGDSGVLPSDQGALEALAFGRVRALRVRRVVVGGEVVLAAA